MGGLPDRVSCHSCSEQRVSGDELTECETKLTFDDRALGYAIADVAFPKEFAIEQWQFKPSEDFRRQRGADDWAWREDWRASHPKSPTSRCHPET